MSKKEVNQEKVEAKLLALSLIYEKEESCRQAFLERMSYSPEEMTAVIDIVSDDPEFRDWIQSVIPAMQCREDDENGIYVLIDDLKKSMHVLVEKTINHWYAPFASGIIFIGAGISAFFFGKATFLTLTVVFSLSFLLAGISEIAFALSNREEMKHWGWLLILGIINIVFALTLVANPFVSIFSITLFVGCAILFRSIGGIILSISLKKTDYSKWRYLLIFSILGILSALFLMAHPLIAEAIVLAFTAISLIFGGIFGMVLSLFLRKLNFLKKEVDRETMKRDLTSWFRGEE